MTTASSRHFKKWDIVYFSRIPDSIKCFNCNRSFTPERHACPHCRRVNRLSNHIAKPRPFLLFKDQSHWVESITFGIPLSTSNLLEITSTTVLIKKGDYRFLHKDLKYYQPMRAVIHQLTRLDGNVLNKTDLLGELTQRTVMKEVEDKLFSWIFD